MPSLLKIALILFFLFNTSQANININALINDVTIKEAIETTTTDSKELHGEAELKMSFIK